MTDVLAPGSVVSGRFRIERLAGRGGMGLVYRAWDDLTGRSVALKLLHGAPPPESVRRFHREAELLAGLRHPGLVAYEAHGTLAQGQHFLAMEWVEGEELRQRLERQPLSPAETLSLVRRVAEALAQAHRQGIVHRDLKPSNLLLRGGRPEAVVVVDFGLARHVLHPGPGVTVSGAVVGTPGYMAPEQAAGQQEVSPAADIFSLGCVLYECLTDTVPFAAPHFAAALAKILFADPHPLHTLRPGLPTSLQGVLDRMLVKDPRRRLADADALLEALAGVEALPGWTALPGPETQSTQEMHPGGGPAGQADAERRLVSVLRVALSPPGDEATVDWTRRTGIRDAMRELLSPYEARVELLADGSLVASLVSERGAATDQATLAARCALVLKERWPGAAVAVVTGVGVVDEQLPVGEVMERAGLLLGRMRDGSRVAMDGVTAGLLGPGFRLARLDSATYQLSGVHESADESRPLMGRPTPCVGREQELGLLEFTLTACIEEPMARAVLVTAPAGMGKSRLRHEFLRRLARWERPLRVMLGRGDPMGAGVSPGLLGQAVRGLWGFLEEEPLEARHARLRRHVASRLPGSRVLDVAEFLGELCALVPPSDASHRLRAAREDPRLMRAQVGLALVEFLAAECAHQPVVLVLEDLHWSDALTVSLVEEVLRALAEQPLLVLALARPEVRELFPDLGAWHVQEVPLKGLSRKACTRLVREVLGEQVPEDVVQRTVDQAHGNALLLEEIIRRVADGEGDSVPETVLAVLQGRLMRMESAVRQVLLAASLFGHAFWESGVRYLLGNPELPLERSLRRLVEQEVIVPQSPSHFPGEEEYRFRHALVRDAAHALVPDHRVTSGHALVGAWLEQRGEPDTLVLARHYQQGRQLERAARCFTLAAEQLFTRNDLEGVIRCVEAAVDCGVEGEARSRLLAFHAMVLLWMDRRQQALELGTPVLGELKAGGSLWCLLLGALLAGRLLIHDRERVAQLSELLLRTTPEPEATAAYVDACLMLGGTALWTGVRAWAEVPLTRMLQAAAAAPNDALVRGWTMRLKGQFLYFYEACPWQSFLVSAQSTQAFEEVGLTLQAALSQATGAMALAALGDVDEALVLLRGALADSQRTQHHLVTSLLRLYLFLTLARSGQPEHWREARSLTLAWVGENTRDAFWGGVSQWLLAQVALAEGNAQEAERHAREACALLQPFLIYRVPARQVLGTALLALGRAEEARRTAEEGVEELVRTASQGFYAVGIHQVLAEACFAVGDGEAGERALREATRLVQLRAADIPEPAVRERFLRQVPENARTLALARERWGEVPEVSPSTTPRVP